MKKIILLLVVFLILFFDSNVYAVCDTADIKRLKEVAANVDVTYEHNVYGDDIDEDSVWVSIYDIVVSGITEELTVVDGDGNKYYSYGNDGNVYIKTSSGERKILIYSTICSGTLLRTITLDLPIFNFNSISDECKKEEFKDLDICAEFLEDKEEIIQGDEFEKVIEEVKKEQSSIFYKIKSFVVENIIYVIIGIVIVLIISIVLFLRHRKRSVLE